MAKIPFSKLGVKVDNEITLLPWGEYNIEIKRYLPMGDKADMISRIINNSVDDNGFYNPLQVKVFLTLETIYTYTNLTFTDKQKENVLKLYDSVSSSGLFEKIIALIPEDEWEDLQNSVWQTISNLYEYKTSVLGILDAVKANYGDMDLNADDIQSKLADPENLELLRGVLNKLG